MYFVKPQPALAPQTHRIKVAGENLWPLGLEGVVAPATASTTTTPSASSSAPSASTPATPKEAKSASIAVEDEVDAQHGKIEGNVSNDFAVSPPPTSTAAILHSQWSPR
jgi:hypothetical protein